LPCEPRDRGPVKISVAGSQNEVFNQQSAELPDPPPHVVMGLRSGEEPTPLPLRRGYSLLATFLPGLFFSAFRSPGFSNGVLHFERLLPGLSPLKSKNPFLRIPGGGLSSAPPQRRRFQQCQDLANNCVKRGGTRLASFVLAARHRDFHCPTTCRTLPFGFQPPYPAIPSSSPDY